MPTLQEQDQDCADPYSLRCQTALPGAAVYEHRGKNVYQPLRSFNSLSEIDWKGAFFEKGKKENEATHGYLEWRSLNGSRGGCQYQPSLPV